MNLNKALLYETMLLPILARYNISPSNDYSTRKYTDVFEPQDIIFIARFFLQVPPDTRFSHDCLTGVTGVSADFQKENLRASFSRRDSSILSTKVRFRSMLNLLSNPVKRLAYSVARTAHSIFIMGVATRAGRRIFLIRKSIQ